MISSNIIMTKCRNVSNNTSKDPVERFLKIFEGGVIINNPHETVTWELAK